MRINGRIVINQEVMAGKPVIRGTRIPVDAIINLLANGVTEQELLDDYPNLTKEDIRAALDYAAKRIRGEEVFPIFEAKKKPVEI